MLEKTVFCGKNAGNETSEETHDTYLVPEEGVEPTRPCGQRILSPPRLPFRHSGGDK